MNTVQTFRFASLIVASSVALCTSNANAASLIINPTTVNAVDVFTGPTFTVNGDYLGTDTISLNVSGTVNLNDATPTGYTTNAAGVLTQLGTLGSQGSAVVNPATGFDYGALLLGNSTLGFKQLFPASAANGLGSSSTPTDLSLSNVALSTLFGSQGLANGTVLQFLVSDSNTTSNSGAFTVRGSIDGATSVPEPFTIIGSLVGGTAALRMKKKLEADKN
jgi:hypothetical protein